MAPLRIDFAPPSFGRTLMRASARAWGGGIVGLTMCITAALAAADLLSERAGAEAEMQNIRSRIAEQTARKPTQRSMVITDAQAHAVNTAVAQLNLPWRDVLDAIEAATPGTIALLTIDPDAKKLLIKGIAEAKNSDGMIEYIEKLKRQPFFKDVILTRHEVNEQDPNKPLRFQFEAYWAEASQ